MEGGENVAQIVTAVGLRQKLLDPRTTDMACVMKVPGG